MELITKETQAEYEAFLSSHPKGHFMQSFAWSKLKSSWKFEVIVLRNDAGQIFASIGFLIRKLPGLPYTLMYAPRGPVCDIHDTAAITKLIQDSKELGKKYKACMLKIDPDIKSEETQFVKTLTDLGFVLKAGKNFEGVQPRYVFRLNVQGKTADELMAGFHSKTRYNIRVAQKNGVIVKRADQTSLNDFHRIMIETGMRDHFVTRPREYFEKMLTVMGENARLYMAYFEGKPIAGTIAVRYGNKVWYLYGASSNEYRNVMPNYLLQFEMIKWAVDSSCEIYDFRGVSGDLNPDNPLYGLYKFKKGFNGEFTEFVGEFDLVTNPFVYMAIQKARHLLSVVTQKIYKIKNRGK